jgi:hypothetical protein
MIFHKKALPCLANLSRVLHRGEEVNNVGKVSFYGKRRCSPWPCSLGGQGIRGLQSEDRSQKLPLPKTFKDVRSFLGHASLYRRFLKDFSKTFDQPPFDLNDDCVNAFRRLREALISAPINLRIGTFLSSLCAVRAITR